jgi:SAM-dependent methyltransferase
LSLDSTRRFSERADWYSRYPPSYPQGILPILQKKFGFNNRDVVADIGSGTGLLSRLFLENGNRVFGVEPNARMRSYAERDLTGYKNFVSVAGTAERTTLRGKSIDLITVGQALHWFDPSRAAKEFRRISRSGGNICVVYNDRKNDRFGRAYEEVIRRNERNRAKEIRRSYDDYHISRFFLGGKCSSFTVPNEQLLDFGGLMGRFLSASYMPTPGEKRRFAEMRRDVTALFDEFSRDGKVKIGYRTKLFVGPVGPP